jgi:hypothetical protein
MLELTSSAYEVLLDIRNKEKQYEQEQLFVRLSIGNC